jgi:hypothetical protein
MHQMRISTNYSDALAKKLKIQNIVKTVESRGKKQSSMKWSKSVEG